MDTFYYWQTGDTWRKVAYLYYNDSRQWRRILELNPSYTINEHPAHGVRIKVASGQAPNVQPPRALRGTLQQTPTTLDLTTNQNNVTAKEGFDYWPWSSQDLAVRRMSTYPFQALLQPSDINGLTLEDASKYE